MTNQQHPAQFDWATELLDTQGHITLSAQEANEIGARLRSMGDKLKTYEDLDEAASDVQLLRMGYAAARLEIESLQARIKTMAEERSDELAVAHLDGRMRAAQPTDAILGEQAELRRLSGCCPELNLSNYGHDDVDELNGRAIEVSQCIDRALAAQPASKPSPASQGDALSQAASDVLAERQRQISAEGRTQSHDDLEHEPGQLSSAAACYALNASEWLTRPYVSRAGYATLSFIDLSNWPWDGSRWKPKNEREDLVRAGALIIAELERMDRADTARAAQEGK